MKFLLGTALAAHVLLVGARAQNATTEFVGSVPCGDAVRSFLGGMERGAACHAARWKLVLDASRNGTGAWTAAAVYGVPPPGDPNQMIEGPKVVAKGVYQHVTGGRGSIKATYRLAIDGSQRSLSFAQVGDDLLHLLTTTGELAVGTAGWSYTLHRADRMEPPGSPSTSPDMSYTISQRASGGALFGIFEGRTACAGIARELRISPAAGCLKVKWRLTLFRDAKTSQPTGYKIESSLHRTEARTGSWQSVRGAATDANADVYQLSATASEGPMLLLKGSDDVLFMLDQQRRPLVGNADFGYALNRVAR